MNKALFALAVGLFLAVPEVRSTASENTIEQRLQQLEQRLLAAEKRAQRAEDKIAQLNAKNVVQTSESSALPVTVVSVTAAQESQKNATPSALKLSGYGDLKVYGDVEFNMDAESRKGTLIRNNDTSNEQWNLNGRILLGVDGYRTLTNGNFAGFSVQPLADMNGGVNLDDAVFFFGQERDWTVKIGRFEARDMFPLNQDTFVKYSGNTADDLYDDGFGYIYMMKEGRGRSGSGGNFLVNKTIDNWYFELNTLIEDGSDLFVDKSYHGYTLTNDKNVVYLRPVMAWSQDSFSIAAAMESNVVSNAYGYYDSRDRWVDQSDRTGYGLTMNWNGLKHDPDNGVVMNINTAYLDAPDEKDFSAGINALWKRFELGYIYAHNNIENFSNVRPDTCDSQCIIDQAGKYDIHTVHASYQIPNVLDMQNFNIYLGAYWSTVLSNNENADNDDRYGTRVRFKYFF
ncbi:carbohydrate porin [Budvicia diplopodorum]|uniref:carbohydrate porin n=1 Tax=Budvicia diplopodorum TaxID=1119056 RepID=UPI001356AD2B|nr:carbohydrate porin [Budvicia diplopodorum]